MSAFAPASAAARRHAWLWRNRDRFVADRDMLLPQLLVDVSSILQEDARTGIQRVVRAIWSELRSRSGDSCEIIPVYATKNHGYCYAPVDFLSRNVAPGQQPVVVRSGDKFLGLDLSSHLLPKYRSQLRAWRERGATTHIVVYDLLPLQRPEWFNRRTCRHFERWYRSIVSTADEALCISDHIASEFAERIKGTPAARNLSIGRIYMGADIEASVPSSGRSAAVEAVFERIGSHPVILMVGTVEPRKGYDVALAAFEHLWSNYSSAAPQLVIVGKPGWKTDGLQDAIEAHPELGRRLHWIKDASDEALSELYKRSNGLLLASRAEGCGLPVLEAAVHGRRSLVRDLPVFREKQLSGTLYFDDDAPQPLAAKLMELVSSPQLMEVAGLHSWSDCADALMQELGFGIEPPALLAVGG